MLSVINVDRAIGATTIEFTGFNGGKLKDRVDICIIVLINDMGKSRASIWTSILLSPIA